jgi:hypothetical protein
MMAAETYSESQRARLAVRPEPHPNPGPERLTHGRHCPCTPCCRPIYDPYQYPPAFSAKVEITRLGALGFIEHHSIVEGQSKEHVLDEVRLHLGSLRPGDTFRMEVSR